MEYKVIYEIAYNSYQAIDSLVKKVNKEMKNGWKPLGGISSYDDYVCQAMIKDSKNESVCRDI